MDSYLEIARRVLSKARQPLSAQEILKAAYQLQIVPRDLYGRTQHKTLHARLSTDILKRRLRSDFFRTAPGRFFLRALKTDRRLPNRYRREYLAPLRSAQLGRFDVVAFPRTDLKQAVFGEARKLLVGDLVKLHWRYCRMDDVRRSSQIVPFRIFVIVVDDGKVLLSHRRRAPDNELAARKTLGFEGFVRRDDRSLFSEDAIGFPDAALRTLAESMELPASALNRLQTRIRLSSTLVLFEETAVPAADDLMVIISLDCSTVPEIAEATTGITTMDWQQLPLRVNDIEIFDLWSSRILNECSLQLTSAR